MLPTTDPNSLIPGALYLLLTMLVGYSLISALLGGGTRHWVQLIAYCHAAGSGVLGFLLFAISLAGYAPNRISLISIAIVAVAILLLLGRRKRLCVMSVPTPRHKLNPLALLAVLSLMLIVAAGANIANSAALPGLNDIDTFGIWAFKAKWLYLSPLRPIPQAFFDPNLSYAHQDYPLLVPFNIAGLYAAVGKIDEDAAKLLLMPTWLALTGIVYGAIRRMHRRAMAVVLTAIFCSAPILARNAGFIVAETPLLLALAGASAQLLCWIEVGDPRELMLGALFIAMAAFTKNEGLALLPVFIFVAIIAGLIPKFDRNARKPQAVDRPTHGPPSIKGLLLAGAVCLLYILPWLILRWHLPHTHEDYGDRLLSAALIRQIPQRFGAIQQFLGWFWDATRAGLTWYLLVFTTILWPGKLCTKPAIALWVILVAQLCLYLATFIVTPWDVNVLVPMITPKLQIQMTPIAILLIAVNLRDRKGAPDVHPGLRA
jgi:hypothetical protein